MFLVETDAVIDRIEFMRAVFKENVTAFAVGVVAEQVEKHNRLQQLFIFFAEIEVMIFGIVLDVLLERTGTVRTVGAQHGKRDKVKAQRLAGHVRGDLAQSQRALGKIPKRLLATRRFINSWIGFIFIMNVNQESVIRAQHELAFEFKLPIL